METKRIIEMAEKAGAFPVGSGADNSFGFRERALVRFVETIAQECIRLCKEHGHSAQFSYTPARAKLVEKGAYGCSQLIARKFEIK